MNKYNMAYSAYLNILREELIPAMGCTEPIALALAAANARSVLGELPDKVMLQVSGSIIKNVKSVIVPNTDNMKGIQVAAAAGIVAGKHENELQVLAEVTLEETQKIKDYLESTEITVEHIEDGHVFDIIVTVYKGEHYAKIRVCDYHTNVVLVEKDGEVLKQVNMSVDKVITDRALMNLEGIWDFATTCRIEDVEEIIENQINCNTAIAEEGLKNCYGAQVGRVLMSAYDKNDVRVRAKAKAAAGSDARMNGCEMPVVINSGSGNQGITVSVPVAEYAKHLGATREQTIRAVVLSNLVAIHNKTGIGTLSAYCGAVSAGAGAGAGIAYLRGGDLNAVKGTITNALATVSGIVCDGAKASCASKIAQSVDMAILGYEMYLQGNILQSGDGLVADDVESTITNIGRLAKRGMAGTNDEIIDIMIEC